MSESGSVSSREGILKLWILGDWGKGGGAFSTVRQLPSWSPWVKVSVRVKSICFGKSGNKDAKSEPEKLFCFRIQDYAPGRCSLASQEVIKVSPVRLDVMERKGRVERIPGLTLWAESACANIGARVGQNAKLHLTAQKQPPSLPNNSVSLQLFHPSSLSLPTFQLSAEELSYVARVQYRKMPPFLLPSVLF